MKVVRASEKDVEEIIKINSQFRKIFEREVKKEKLLVPFLVYDNKKWILEEILKKNQYVAKNGRDSIFGAMCFYAEIKGSPGETYIETLAVKESEHNKGIGRMLVEFAKRKSEKEGSHMMVVDSFSVYNAKKFYLKCGFEMERKEMFLCGNRYYRFFMNL